ARTHPPATTRRTLPEPPRRDHRRLRVPSLPSGAELAKARPSRLCRGREQAVSLTLTDLFAGAGGASTGATHVPGVEVYVAANHWQRAVDVHNANHPDALHVCADVSQINPRRFPRTDILWASPECTNHSIAKGRRLDGAQPDLFGDTLPDEA